MEIQILNYIEGAKQASGLTVIIDVFRAFSFECYAYWKGVARIYPVGDIEEAYERKKNEPQIILAGERDGKKCPGFDFGNSPSRLTAVSLEGKTMVHTTSAGTQGIASAVHAEEIITGSLVNAKAVAAYIKKKNPERVSLVCMGNKGVREAKEDTLCAEYIRSLLTGETFEIRERALRLRENGGEHFFRPDLWEVYPEDDFWMCIDCDRFPFVLKIVEDGEGRKMTRQIPCE